MVCCHTCKLPQRPLTKCCYFHNRCHKWVWCDLMILWAIFWHRTVKQKWKWEKRKYVTYFYYRRKRQKDNKKIPKLYPLECGDLTSCRLAVDRIGLMLLLITHAHGDAAYMHNNDFFSSQHAHMLMCVNGHGDIWKWGNKLFPLQLTAHSNCL